GSILFSEIVNTSQKELSTSSFAKGMYFITITTKQGAKFVKKLMIK
ncbi:MAG: T9SS type A sorting domain-containing protein, partial [Bacteroidetes bacterium]|nr:T9SS type A sorting domain-containing protein [Bacteroidota bacterium]